MAKKGNLFFKNPSEGVVVYQQKIRVVKKKDDGLPKYYAGMKEAFRRFRTAFQSDIQSRDRNRDSNLTIPHINYIVFTFFGSFDSEKFVSRYKQNFGLVPVKFSLFNTRGVFAIENPDKFK